MLSQIKSCRICGNQNLVEVLDLGEQVLTGVFPRTLDQNITRGPLKLLKCIGSEVEDACGLLQLANTYELNEMYGDNYGYRSGLNPSMVNHLHKKVKHILGLVELAPGDIVIDIGSNDSTTLQAYPQNKFKLVGIDPTGIKFREFYPSGIELIADFFSIDIFRARFGDSKAKVVTSFSMFYDLEAPLDFMRTVADILHPDGVWVFEQSYMPTMLERNSYDTVCHEHLEYYGLQQIKWMTDRSGLRIVDVEFNDINGGSFSVTVAHKSSNRVEYEKLDDLLTKENSLGLNSLAPYLDFALRVAHSKRILVDFLKVASESGKRIFALGASTKGNVILQYCDITESQISAVGEINLDKEGCFTPGTLLPIVSENAVLAQKPDYLLVLPWHFREFFQNSAKFQGMKLVFPLPQLEILNENSTTLYCSD